VLFASAFEYTYLLWWNVFWTLCPVIAMGVFDRIVGTFYRFSLPPRKRKLMHYTDDDILMELPELYRYGREGYHYSTKLFVIYMLDAVYQVSFHPLDLCHLAGVLNTFLSRQSFSSSFCTDTSRLRPVRMDMMSHSMSSQQ
jgi:magnesium-transporting ATPase (P-type)